MSTENVGLVRRIYDAVAQRDAVTPFEIYAEDIVWDTSGSARGSIVGARPIAHGHAGVRRGWRDLVDAFGEVDFELEEIVDLGDQVLVTVRDHAVGRSSGAPVESGHFALWTLADGKVTRLQVFDDREPAERAAGLRE